jgi:hypothetical protein
MVALLIVRSLRNSCTSVIEIRTLTRWLPCTMLGGNKVLFVLEYEELAIKGLCTLPAAERTRLIELVGTAW